MTATRPVADPEAASVSYLMARLGVLEARVRSLVDHLRQDDPAPEDPFRGLYISEEHLESILGAEVADRCFVWDDAEKRAGIEQEADALESEGVVVRLRSLARQAHLEALEVDLLLVALAPDLDVRFEGLYGYLNDDVTRRRATVRLALELTGQSPWSARARGRLSGGSQLLRLGLLVVEEPERPYLSRSLRVPDRVAAHLLGSDEADPRLADLLRHPPQLPLRAGHALAESLARCLTDGLRLAYLREPLGASAAMLALGVFEAAGTTGLLVDLDHLGPALDAAGVARLAGREALLRGATVAAGPVEALLDSGGPAAVRAFASLEVPVLLYGRSAWEPSWARQVPLLVAVPLAGAGERAEQWRANLDKAALPQEATADVASQFLLSPEQVERAAEAALLQARLDSAPVAVEHLRRGARAQNGAGLERLARRIEPAVGWGDLVLAPATAGALRELVARARGRDLVLDAWGMRPGGGRGRGVTVLFAGDSGTGKTMSAEVVAGDIGFDLYTVNLATVVDKYVGETEKNLERIFSEANGLNAVLLFDEADALFGKRSEVRDANDRYANIEVAYLLQRMETFDGLAILATNLRANVDEAFARRLDMVVDFPMPDKTLRRVLWERCLGRGVPRAHDLDLDFCAAAFEIAGGNIRNIAVTAAYLAADAGREVTMADLMHAVQREYRKLGRLVVPSEFGPYYSLLGA